MVVGSANAPLNVLSSNLLREAELASESDLNEEDEAWTFEDWVFIEEGVTSGCYALEGAKATYRSKDRGKIRIRGELKHLYAIIDIAQEHSHRCDRKFRMPVEISLNVRDFCKLCSLLQKSNRDQSSIILKTLGSAIWNCLFEPIWYLEFGKTKLRGLQAHRKYVAKFLKIYTPSIYKWVKNQLNLPETKRNPLFEMLLRKMRKSRAPELRKITIPKAKHITSFAIELGIGAELEKVDMRRPLENPERFIRDYVYRKAKRKDYYEDEYNTAVGYMKGLFLNSSNQQS